MIPPMIVRVVAHDFRLLYTVRAKRKVSYCLDALDADLMNDVTDVIFLKFRELRGSWIQTSSNGTEDAPDNRYYLYR
jgi:hypothetical protein